MENRLKVLFRVSLLCILSGLLFFSLFTACEVLGNGDNDGNGASVDISVRTSDSTEVSNGDTIEPIGFQGIQLISSPEYRTITITNESGSSLTINNIEISGDEDFSLNTAESGLNLWEKEELQLSDEVLAADDTYEFHLDFCPVSGGTRTAEISITYNTDSSFTFTVSATGRPEEITGFSQGSLDMHKIWGGYNTNQDEMPGAMVADSAGNIYFAGNGKYLSNDTFYYDIFVGKVAAEETLGWVKVYHSEYKDYLPDPGQNDESGGSANSLCMDDSGNLYLAASVGKGSNNAFLAMVMKINPVTGEEIWKKYWFPDTDRLSYTDSAEIYGIEAANDTIYVTGGSYDYTSGVQGISVFALDASSGNLEWSKIINPNGNEYKDRGYAVKAFSTDALYVAGYHGESTGDAFLCKLNITDTDATLAWAQNYSIGTGSNFNSMDVDASGNVYLSADRRGATTYFSVLKVSADGSTVNGKTFPGTDGDRNNTKVVRIIDGALYAGGRIGYSGLDTQMGDGLLVKISPDDLSLDWAAAYYTGKGSLEICEHYLKGIAMGFSEIILFGQVYTGNSNYYRYYGSWFDLPASLEDYSPSFTNTTSSTTIEDFTNDGLVEGTENGGVYEDLAASTNTEFQDAEAKNEATNGSQVDGDCFFMKLDLSE